MSEENKKNRCTHALLIWEELPEAVSLFLIPRKGLSKTEKKILKLTHGNYVNSSGHVMRGNATKDDIDRSLTLLSDMLMNPENSWINNNYIENQARAAEMEFEDYKALIGKWFKYKVDKSVPRSLPTCRVFVSGFFV